MSPILLHGETIVWAAVPVFVAVGLVFPSLLTIVTFASNRALGPILTGALGNLSPLLAVALAVLVLGEPLRPLQFVGLVVSVMGALVLSVNRTADMRDWRTWALLLPLAASVMRGIIPPVVKIGLELWPNPIAAALVAYIASSVTVLSIERVRTGRLMTNAPLVLTDQGTSCRSPGRTTANWHCSSLRTPMTRRRSGWRSVRQHS